MRFTSLFSQITTLPLELVTVSPPPLLTQPDHCPESPDQTIQQVNATTTIMPRRKRTSLSLNGTRKRKRMRLMRAAHNDGQSTTNVCINDTQVSPTTRPATATLPTTTRRKLSRSRDAERRPMRISRATDTRKQKTCCPKLLSASQCNRKYI